MAAGASPLTSNDAVSAYVAAWGEPDDEARRELLERAWADDGLYCDPLATVVGRDALVAHIGGFRERMPGHRIVLTTVVDEHDGWLRFGWRILDASGAPALDGLDVGELGPDGRLRRIVGFFGPLAPAEEAAA